jgi:hypothetical protein
MPEWTLNEALPQLAEPGCCVACKRPVETFNSEYYLLDGGEVAHAAEPCASKAIEFRPRSPIRVRDDSLYSTIVVQEGKAVFFSDVLAERIQRRARRLEVQEIHAQKPKTRR